MKAMVTKTANNIPLQYHQHVIQFRQKHSYLLSQIGNTDEMPVYFHITARRTVDVKDKNTILMKTSGNEKLHITVMLAVLADKLKIPPFVILKSKNLPRENLPSGIIFKVMKKDGSMDGCLDAFKGHLKESVKSAIQDSNINHVITPGGITSQPQVLDVCVNKPFKDLQRLCWGTGLKLLGIVSHKVVSHFLYHKDLAFNPLCDQALKCCLSNELDSSEDHVQ
ncbi:hypothetical protein PR048_004385 [Dryococelus australis]|uniref:Uncharacterized protein n=1 Tax=Dryococelus australis TaxID=614101 RepID=A0ABQ9I649_9NEOP|nr:hypothetical protein PR048_004385 [Dryococelus australis]